MRADRSASHLQMDDREMLRLSLKDFEYVTLLLTCFNECIPIASDPEMLSELASDAMSCIEDAAVSDEFTRIVLKHGWDPSLDCFGRDVNASELSVDLEALMHRLCAPTSAA
jgi:hypothetical protein